MDKKVKWYQVKEAYEAWTSETMFPEKPGDYNEELNQEDVRWD